MYTGQAYFSRTGLYHHGTWFYDFATGRFVAQDSYPVSIRDPSSMNLYASARVNPMRYTAPLGYLSMANRYDFGGTTGNVVISCPSGSTSCQVNPDLTTGTTCTTGGVCTITTTETSGGYTEQISTTSSTLTDNFGDVTSYSATTAMDSTLGGGTRTSTTWTETEDSGTRVVTPPPYMSPAAQFAEANYQMASASDPYKTSACRGACRVEQGVVYYVVGWVTLYFSARAVTDTTMKPIPAGG